MVSACDVMLVYFSYRCFLYQKSSVFLGFYQLLNRAGCYKCKCTVGTLYQTELCCLILYMIFKVTLPPSGLTLHTHVLIVTNFRLLYFVMLQFEIFTHADISVIQTLMHNTAAVWRHSLCIMSQFYFLSCLFIICCGLNPADLVTLAETLFELLVDNMSCNQTRWAYHSRPVAILCGAYGFSQTHV